MKRSQDLSSVPGGDAGAEDPLSTSTSSSLHSAYATHQKLQIAAGKLHSRMQRPRETVKQEEDVVVGSRVQELQVENAEAEPRTPWPTI